MNAYEKNRALYNLLMSVNGNNTGYYRVLPKIKVLYVLLLV